LHLPQALLALAAPALLVIGVSTVPALAGSESPGPAVAAEAHRDAVETSSDDASIDGHGRRSQGGEATLDEPPLGVVVDFNPATGLLVVAKLGGGSITSVVTSATRIDLTAVSAVADRSTRGGGSIAHLAAGALVARLKVDEGSRTVEQVGVIGVS